MCVHVGCVWMLLPRSPRDSFAVCGRGSEGKAAGGSRLTSLLPPALGCDVGNHWVRPCVAINPAHDSSLVFPLLQVFEKEATGDLGTQVG